MAWELERAADGCYLAGDDRRAWYLYAEAAHEFRRVLDLESAARCAEMQAAIRNGGAS